MKTADVAICTSCVEDRLRPSQLVYKRVPGTEGQSTVCEFCKQKRYTTVYRIQYGRDRACRR